MAKKNKAKDQTKGNGLFQPFLKAIENFKKKQKVENFQQMKIGGKKRERQIKEEQQKLINVRNIFFHQVLVFITLQNKKIHLCLV